MSIAPNELLSNAKILCEGNEEFHWRCAASKAYYAAYHQCKMAAETLPEPPYASKAMGVHDTLIKKLSTQSDLKLKSIGFMLREAKRLRNKADYDIDTLFEQWEAKETIKWVEKIFAKLIQ
jgi:uncharacterized protein (UPF0332 family)